MDLSGGGGGFNNNQPLSMDIKPALTDSVMVVVHNTDPFPETQLKTERFDVLPTATIISNDSIKLEPGLENIIDCGEVISENPKIFVDHYNNNNNSYEENSSVSTELFSSYEPDTHTVNHTNGESLNEEENIESVNEEENIESFNEEGNIDFFNEEENIGSFNEEENIELFDEEDLVNVDNEEYSFYKPNEAKSYKFGRGLTVLEMVRLHFDPYISQFDLSREPVLVLEKVDKYWPVPRTENSIKTEVKEEPIDISEDDIEWDKAAEAEILAANEGFNEGTNINMERGKNTIKKELEDDEGEDVDDPDELSNHHRIMDEDDSFEDDRSDVTYSPDIFENESLLSNDEDDLEADLSLVKLEDMEIIEDDGNVAVSRANGILASSQNVKIVDIGGHKVETYGDYSKCPKCQKNIKSTFIIRHIKLHDLPTSVMKCPFEECATSFTRSNNLYRHLKVVHVYECPYICIYKNCTEKFSASKELREHVNKTHRKGVRKELEEMEASNLRYKCEFPGCEREYGKKQHLKEHFRKHTGDMRYACEVCGERFFVHGHMKRHLYSHTGIKPHACRWKCGAIFASYGGRMKHERAQHSENPYKLDCDICGRPFRFERELDKHKLTHLAPHERMAYRCSYCGIIFDSISHRERHEQRHKDNDTFQCEDCSKMFKNEKNLRHHYKTHHEKPHPKKADDDPSKRQAPEKKEKKEPPKYPCHVCDIPVMFALTALRRHLARKHSTNYKCPKENCGKTFAKQYQFDAHMKLHMHRSCHMCGKQFKRKQNADIHLMGVHGLTKEDLVTLGR